MKNAIGTWHVATDRVTAYYNIIQKALAVQTSQKTLCWYINSTMFFIPGDQEMASSLDALVRNKWASGQEINPTNFWDFCLINEVIRLA